MIGWFAKKLKKITSVGEMEELLRICVEEPHSTFQIEIEKLDYLTANPMGNERMRGKSSGY